MMIGKHRVSLRFVLFCWLLGIVGGLAAWLSQLASAGRVHL
jgi:hypothetical protein